MASTTNDIDTLARDFYLSLAPGGPSSAEQLVSEDWQQIPLGEHYSPGRKGYDELVQFVRTVFSNIEVIIDDVLVDGDRAAVRSTLRGVHTGAPLMGHAPTGRLIELRACDIHRVADGRIVQSWHLEDFAGLQQQLTAPLEESR